MSNFIALRPVTFDRGYEIGEEIPAGVVAPGSVKRLVDSGWIAKIPAAGQRASRKGKRDDLQLRPDPN